ncbi:MAG: hypothetical protein ABI150_02745 [Nitrobacter sp.]
MIAVQNVFDLLNQRDSPPKLCERLALLTIHVEPADVPAAI